MNSRITDIAWLAGFLDGEGTFQIINVRKTGSGPMYDAQLAATNTDIALLNRCQHIAGGSVYGPNGRGDPRWKDSYRWALRGKKLGPLLDELLPFLVSKREQASILIALRSEVRPGASLSEWGRKPLDQDTLDRRLEYKMAMHALNHRGALPPKPEYLAALAAFRQRTATTAQAV
jgi:hypothetical protein